MATYAGHTYANGRVPAAALARLDPVGGNGVGRNETAHLRADAAAAWNRARADVERRTGIVLTVRGWNRTLAEQQRFFHAAYQPRASGGTDARWYQGVRYVRRPGKAAAAIPGTSNHGWGLAVDVSDFGGVGQWNHPRRTAAFPILAEHGWTDTEGRRPDTNEPWHLVYSPARDQHRDQPAPAPAPTPTTPAKIAGTHEMETLMAYPFMFRGNDNDVWTVAVSPSETFDVSLPGDDQRTKRRAGLVALFGEPQTIGEENAKRLRAALK